MANTFLKHGLLGFAALVVAFPALAQNSPSARLDRLEREVQTLSRSVFKGDVPPSQVQSAQTNSASAGMEVRFNQLESQLQSLTGQIEQQGFQLRQLENKLNAMEQAKSSVSQNQPTTSDATDNTGDTKTISIGNVDSKPIVSQTSGRYQLGTISNNNTATPAGLYDQAFEYLQNNDYDAAETSFKEFIEKYPDHSLASNAQYWLGETYYARADYDQASRIFAQSYQKYPKGNKAPDTLLKLAMSLGNRDMTQEACLTLAELKGKFPDGAPSVMKKADEKSGEYNCQ